MGKNKLAKFSDMEGFPHVFQSTYNDLKQTENFAFPLKGKWSEFFGNNNPIIVELGCGKGEYTVAQAEMNPDRNYIGVDIKGARMWTGAKDSLQKGLKNVAFVRTNIEALNGFFEKGEVSEIWLTFPDPQMKKVNKRLTSTVFMRLYQQVVAEGGLIHLKTDSHFMFTYTCLMADANHYEVKQKIDDLYASDMATDRVLSIKTYYEQQWLSRGITIKYIDFVLTHRDSFIEPTEEIEFDTYRSFGRNARTLVAEKTKENNSLEK